ncbi:unnamed protein product [Lampetra planeri]
MSAKTAAAASSNSANRECASWRLVSEASGASAITAKCCIGANSSSSPPEVGVPARPTWASDPGSHSLASEPHRAPVPTRTAGLGVSGH